MQIKRESYVSVGLENSDIIFLGELIDSLSSNQDYAFKILEVFKGNYKSKVLKGHVNNSCSLHPYDSGLWLIYATFQNDSSIDIGMCGPSVSLKNPQGLIYPPSITFEKDRTVDQLNWKIEGVANKLEGLSYWYSDLYKLREYKQSNQMDTSKEKFDYKLLIIGFSLILNIFMFIVVIKKKCQPTSVGVQ